MTPEQQAAIREAMREALFVSMRWCGGEGCPSLPCACADAMAAAHLKALEVAGIVLCPAEPTDEMLSAAIPFPEHLRAKHPDPSDPWHLAMEAACIAERMALRQRYMEMIAVRPR